MSNSSYVELVGAEPTPVFTIPKNCLPRNSLFSKLRDIWKEQGVSIGERRRSKDLAKLLTEVASLSGCSPVREQAVSQWATGSDNREPPWWAIMSLAHATGHYIELRPHVVRIKKVKEDDGVVR